jgi:hypothetical protein
VLRLVPDPALTVARPGLRAQEAEALMPPKTARQQRFMGAELARKRSGKATKTKMSEQQLEEFAAKPKGRKSTRKKG